MGNQNDLVTTVTVTHCNLPPQFLPRDTFVPLLGTHELWDKGNVKTF